MEYKEEVIKNFLREILHTENKVIFGSTALNVNNKDLDIAILVDDYREIVRNYNQEEMTILENCSFPIENYFNVRPTKKALLFKFHILNPIIYEKNEFQYIDVLLLFDNDLKAVKKSIEILKTLPSEVLQNKENRINIYEILLKTYGWNMVGNNI